MPKKAKTGVMETCGFLYFLVPPYDPDGQFSMSALCRLENKGIQVLTSLAACHKKLTEAAKVTFTGRANFEYKHSSSKLEIVIRHWTLGENPTLPPTWRSLYQVLRELGLEELSQQIEEFLSGEYCSRLDL